MRIVTGHTVFDDPLAGPVGDTLAVGTADPVFFLSEMTLRAQLVAVVHIHIDTRFGFQKITFLPIMTRKTGKRFFRTAMIESDLAMGHFSSPGDTDRFIVMTLAAFKALDLVFAGFGPENPPCIHCLRRNDICRRHQDRVDALLIINRCVGIFINLRNTALPRMRGPPGKANEQ